MPPPISDAERAEILRLLSELAGQDFFAVKGRPFEDIPPVEQESIRIAAAAIIPGKTTQTLTLQDIASFLVSSGQGVLRNVIPPGETQQEPLFTTETVNRFVTQLEADVFRGFSDAGVPFTQEMQDDIFEPFVNDDDEREGSIFIQQLTEALSNSNNANQKAVPLITDPGATAVDTVLVDVLNEEVETTVRFPRTPLRDTRKGQAITALFDAKAISPELYARINPQFTPTSQVTPEGFTLAPPEDALALEFLAQFDASFEAVEARAQANEIRTTFNRTIAEEFQKNPEGFATEVTARQQIAERENTSILGLDAFNPNGSVRSGKDILDDLRPGQNPQTLAKGPEKDVLTRARTLTTASIDQALKGLSGTNVDDVTAAGEALFAILQPGIGEFDQNIANIRQQDEQQLLSTKGGAKAALEQIAFENGLDLASITPGDLRDLQLALSESGSVDNFTGALVENFRDFQQRKVLEDAAEAAFKELQKEQAGIQATNERFLGASPEQRASIIGSQLPRFQQEAPSSLSTFALQGRVSAADVAQARLSEANRVSRLVEPEVRAILERGDPFVTIADAAEQAASRIPDVQSRFQEDIPSPNLGATTRGFQLTPEELERGGFGSPEQFLPEEATAFPEGRQGGGALGVLPLIPGTIQVDLAAISAELRDPTTSLSRARELQEQLRQLSPQQLESAGRLEQAQTRFPTFQNRAVGQEQGPLFGTTGIALRTNQPTGLRAGQEVRFGGGPLIRVGGDRSDAQAVPQRIGNRADFLKGGRGDRGRAQFVPASEAGLRVDPLDIDPLSVTERITELAGGDLGLFNAFQREVPRFQAEFQQEEARRFAGVSRNVRAENREILSQTRAQRFSSIQRDIKSQFQPRSLEDFISGRSERFKSVFSKTPAGQQRRQRRGITRFMRPV